MSQVRVSKLLAERGICSRREADTFIERGWVFIDGKPVILGEKTDPRQAIELDPRAERQQERRITVLLNKPVGYVSGQAEKSYKPATVLITKENCTNARAWPNTSKSVLHGLAPAGRLDIDSQGLLVLTQDGRIARNLIGPDSEIEKEYVVRVSGNVTEEKLKLLQHGLSLDGRKLKPAEVNETKPGVLRFVLREGRKRQIRRMCEQVELQVMFLKRIRIGNIKLGRLPLGKWRFLRNDEQF